ncbi:MAG: chorismate mutase [Acidobacteria bacterium]|nr:chorismate mutase [Acidobacteriota bacterium]
MSADPRAGIEALRGRIDALDGRLVELLSERAQCALEVGELKRALQVAVYQPAREREVLDHVCAVNRGPLDDEAMRRLFERIIDEARRLERVAAGIPGTIESED